MAWEVEYTDEFGHWWAGLSVGEQDGVAAMAGDKRLYERMIPLADGLYDAHLEELRQEGLL